MRVSRYAASKRILLAQQGALVALCLLLVGGCRQRQQIADTVKESWQRIEPNSEQPFRVDPALLKWRELTAIATGLEQPRAIALDAADKLYVGGDGEVRVVEDDGAVGARFEVAGEPQALAVGDGGKVYVALQQELLSYSADGKLLERWDPPGERNHLTGVAVAGNEVYVADAGERAVFVVSSPVRRIGDRDEARGIPGIICRSPCLDVATTAEGNVVITNPGRFRVETYRPDGTPVRHFGKSSLDLDGFSGCCNPTHLAVFADGRIVTAEKSWPRVKVCNPDGSIESVVALPHQLPREGRGLDLAVDRAGRVLMLDPVAKTVRVFEEAKVSGR